MGPMFVPSMPMSFPPCRACGHVGPAMVHQKVSGGGWVLFVLMFIGVCTLPFCWIPLVLMKDRFTVCDHCRTPT